MKTNCPKHKPGNLPGPVGSLGACSVLAKWKVWVGNCLQPCLGGLLWCQIQPSSSSCLGYSGKRENFLFIFSLNFSLTAGWRCTFVCANTALGLETAFERLLWFFFFLISNCFKWTKWVQSFLSLAKLRWQRGLGCFSPLCWEETCFRQLLLLLLQ